MSDDTFTTSIREMLTRYENAAVRYGMSLSMDMENAKEGRKGLGTTEDSQRLLEEARNAVSDRLSGSYPGDPRALIRPTVAMWLNQPCPACDSSDVAIPPNEDVREGNADGLVAWCQTCGNQWETGIDSAAAWQNVVAELSPRAVRHA